MNNYFIFNNFNNYFCFRYFIDPFYTFNYDIDKDK